MWRGQTEDDNFNALVLAAGLMWRDVALIRTIARFLRQIRLPYSQSYMGATLAKFSVSATDDGLPKRRGETVGMTVEWEKFRGPGAVTFSQIKQPLKDGKADVTASFSEPGSYVLMAVVDDGSGESAGNFGYHCCWTNVQVTVNGTGGSTGGGGACSGTGFAGGSLGGAGCASAGAATQTSR